jgi:hypothetical protein
VVGELSTTLSLSVGVRKPTGSPSRIWAFVVEESEQVRN